MEKELKNSHSKNENNLNDKEELNMKNENYDLNDFHFSFEKIKDLNETNFFSGIISEKENLNIKNNQNYDFDEDNKEENIVLKTILDDLNKNIEINVKEIENENKNYKNYKECQEIIEILKYPLSDKNIRDVFSPFKPLLKPKKISLVGRVLLNIDNDYNNSCNNTTENCSSNCNNNGNIKSGNIKSGNIKSDNIKSGNIKSSNIKSNNIKSSNI